jgi:hypothetical protein
MLTMLEQSLRIIHICQRLMLVVLALEDDDAMVADSPSLGTTSAPCRRPCFQDIFFSRAGCLGILDLERFSRALRLRWLWLNWTDSNRPWAGSQIPCDKIDAALFRASTSVTVGNELKTNFWHDVWLSGKAPIDIAPSLYPWHGAKIDRWLNNWLTSIGREVSGEWKMFNRWLNSYNCGTILRGCSSMTRKIAFGGYVPKMECTLPNQLILHNSRALIVLSKQNLSGRRTPKGNISSLCGCSFKQRSSQQIN